VLLASRWCLFRYPINGRADVRRRAINGGQSGVSFTGDEVEARAGPKDSFNAVARPNARAAD
jgi:hypothetical protein